jgi:hypothetical protein
MKRSISLRPAQQLTGTLTSTRTLRALLLGGLALLGSAGAALAQGAPAVKAKQGNAQSLWLTVENPTQQRMHLKVISIDTRTYLVNEANRRTSYGSKLDFTGMPAGKYAVLVNVGREHYRYNVDVQGKAETTISVRELTPAQTPDAVASATR